MKSQASFTNRSAFANSFVPSTDRAYTLNISPNCFQPKIHTNHPPKILDNRTISPTNSENRDFQDTSALGTWYRNASQSVSWIHAIKVITEHLTSRFINKRFRATFPNKVGKWFSVPLCERNPSSYTAHHFKSRSIHNY